MSQSDCARLCLQHYAKECYSPLREKQAPHSSNSGPSRVEGHCSSRAAVYSDLTLSNPGFPLADHVTSDKPYNPFEPASSLTWR